MAQHLREPKLRGVQGRVEVIYFRETVVPGSAHLLPVFEDPESRSTRGLFGPMQGLIRLSQRNWVGDDPVVQLAPRCPFCRESSPKLRGERPSCTPCGRRFTRVEVERANG